MRHAVGEAQEIQYLLRFPLRGGGFLPGDQRRYHHVLQRRELRQELVELEDEADVLVAESGQLLATEAARLRAVYNEAPAIRRVQRADNLEQGGLARAAGAYDRHDLARVDGQVDSLQHLQGTETLCYAFGLYHIKFLMTCEARKHPKMAGM